MKRLLVAAVLLSAAPAHGFGQTPDCAAPARAPAAPQDSPPGDGLALPSVRIERLQVRVVTSRRRGSGTDNAVYFDIGPLAWRLNKSFRNDFEGGSRDTYELPLPAGVELTTDDILWLRLQKKGLLGVLGTRDGLTGAWLPERVQLIVNGVEHPQLGFAVGRSLNSRCWVWKAEVKRFDHDGDEGRFVGSLRLKKNSKLSWLARKAGFLTTPLFKKRGISGWLPQPQPPRCDECPQRGGCAAPLPRACAAGVVVESDKSTDGLATIDLRLEKIGFCPGEGAPCAREFVLDERHGFKSPRFLRVEYSHRGNRVPEKGGGARICGDVLWDTDREGWYEIHPRGPADVTLPK